MVYKPTSTASPIRSRAAAFTLAEYMVAMSIGLMVLAAAVVLWAYASRTCAQLLNYVTLSASSKNALDQMSQEIRNATAVQACSINRLIVNDPSGTNIDYAYDGTLRTLTKTKGGQATTLLSGCSSFRFSFFQRTPTNGTYDLTTTTSTNLVKVVQMQWTCGRRLTGDKTNFQSQVSSKVVIRSM